MLGTNVINNPSFINTVIKKKKKGPKKVNTIFVEAGVIIHGQHLLPVNGQHR